MGNIDTLIFEIPPFVRGKFCITEEERNYYKKIADLMQSLDITPKEGECMFNYCDGREEIGSCDSVLNYACLNQLAECDYRRIKAREIEEEYNKEVEGEEDTDSMVNRYYDERSSLT